MAKRFLSLILGALLPVMLLACKANEPAAADTGKGAGNAQYAAFLPVDTLQSDVGKSLSNFSLDLFRRVAAENANKNVFLSPLSVWLALGMACNGAGGSTAAAMAKALHAEGISLDDLNRDNAGLTGILVSADPQVDIAIANSVWISAKDQQQINQGFIAAIKKGYGSEPQSVDFTGAGAADAINQWVQKSTGGKIQQLVQKPLDAHTVMMLINAVTFSGQWAKGFDPRLTVDGKFTTALGSRKSVKYMFRKGDNIGYADETIRVACLPYGSGRLQMIAILPVKQPIADFIKGITTEKLQSYIDRCEQTEMALTFPKYSVEYKVTLNDALSAMGMKEAFQLGSADFTNMSTAIGHELAIFAVIHRANIQVDEQGTQASGAAADQVTVAATEPPQLLNFTQPFIYLIRDSKTGAILFIGTMENPD